MCTWWSPAACPSPPPKEGSSACALKEIDAPLKAHQSARHRLARVLTRQVGSLAGPELPQPQVCPAAG